MEMMACVSRVRSCLIAGPVKRFHMRFIYFRKLDSRCQLRCVLPVILAQVTMKGKIGNSAAITGLGCMCT